MEHNEAMKIAGKIFDRLEDPLDSWAHDDLTLEDIEKEYKLSREDAELVMGIIEWRP